jgi:hypothetical protein
LGVGWSVLGYEPSVTGGLMTKKTENKKDILKRKLQERKARKAKKKKKKKNKRPKGRNSASD